MKCRSCLSDNSFDALNLHTSPPSNAFIAKVDAGMGELYFPLRLFVCQDCWLLQTYDYVAASDLFTNNYVYFSSFSKSWLEHSRILSELVIKELKLNSKSLVYEIASNDGYLLDYFMRKQIPNVGIEPTLSTHVEAIRKGIRSVNEFLTQETSNQIVAEYGKADLVIGNNVLAHVPDLIDFINASKNLLNDQGTLIFEFPHLLNLLRKKEFDTIYHEHFSYISLISLRTLLSNVGMEIYRVQELETHGGSLRVWIKKNSNQSIPIENSVNKILTNELEFGLNQTKTFESLQSQLDNIAIGFINFLLSCKKDGKKVIGYGAAAKGNTLLNYAGIHSNLLNTIVDRNLHKIGTLTPGSRIEVCDPSLIEEIKPDYIIVFPWNLLHEIKEQLAYVRVWNCKFVTLIPQIEFH